LAFITGEAAHNSLINIGTTEPTVDRLRNRPELAGNRRDRCPLRVVLVSVCPHQPDGLPPDLLWVLACSCHSSILSKVGASIRPGEVQRVPLGFLTETCDVGSESGTLVSEDYDARANEFSGRIRWVQIDLGEDAEDADHLISPQERLQIAMAKK
jgi:hypothetical protein